MKHHLVLIYLSEGYPRVSGRLDTRYAPVRRSPPQYCYLVLPLDLHVLSLELAFILSQDQTLHCKISYVLLLVRFNLLKNQIYQLCLLTVSVSYLSKNCTTCLFISKSFKELFFKHLLFESGCKGKAYF